MPAPLSQSLDWQLIDFYKCTNDINDLYFTHRTWHFMMLMM